MNRKNLVERLIQYKDQTDISYALEELAESNNEAISNDEIHSIWHYVSKSLDHTFSDDEDHPMWALELELSKLYIRD